MTIPCLLTLFLYCIIAILLSELLTKTIDRGVFVHQLSLISVYGGDDCPEMSMSGIEKGLKESLPGSYLYVYTDAVAKDHESHEIVRNLAIKKKIQVKFFQITDKIIKTIFFV